MQAEEPIIDISLPQPMKETAKKPLFGWYIWAFLLVFVSGAIGLVATSILLKLPKSANCNTVFWPLASASQRLYCAELKADERTADGLLEAIKLVSNLSSDHPLRSQIDASVEEWAAEFLKLGEEKFQAGKLDEAIAIAKKIPDHLQAYELVADKIEQWQTIWSEAETTYNLVDRELRQSNWNQAFREAVKLTYVDNEYWATQKYQEAVNTIQVAREESSKLDNAYLLVRQSGVDNLLKALKETQQIPSSSYAYQESQKLVIEIENKLKTIGEELIAQEKWQELLDIANKIPLNLNIQAEVGAWSQLAKAGIAASLGTMDGLQTALIQAQDIPEASPLYEKAKSLITLWQKEKDDVTHITRARQLAQFGTVASLVSAIAEAQLIPQYNPRYQEAQKYVKDWRDNIQVIEDQPILDRAKQLGVSSDAQILQEAIAQASLISQGRVLYPEAQRHIAQWRSTIQRQEDQPILDRATNLANTNNLSGAIQTAQQIQSGRALYGEAQQKIRDWQQEIKGNKLLQEAKSVASQGSLDALIQAIRIVNQIPSNTRASNDGIIVMNDWSYQVLRYADSQASRSLAQAITIAQNIPSSSGAYRETRQKIRGWENQQLENQGRISFKEAANLARRGTPDALSQAIAVARKVPSSTQVKKESIEAINNWSYQILKIAEMKSRSSLEEAIAVAEKVPSGTAAYQTARNQISGWQQLLKPPVVPAPVQEINNN